MMTSVMMLMMMMMVCSELCLLNAQMDLSLNSQESGVYHNSEAECVCLCQLARLHADQVTLDDFTF